MRIFLSYRRGITSDMAGRIDDQLRQHFGDQSVFRDVDNVPLGHDFHEYLSAAVVESKVFLALIGTDWLRNDLNREDDFVRQEIEAAFRARLLVIPVVIAPATLPNATDLPESLRPLLRRQALQLDSGTTFKSQIRSLITSIESRVALPPITYSSLEIPVLPPQTPPRGSSASSTEHRAVAIASQSNVMGVTGSEHPVQRWPLITRFTLQQTVQSVAFCLLGVALSSAYWYPKVPALSVQSALLHANRDESEAKSTEPPSSQGKEPPPTTTKSDYSRLVEEAVAEYEAGNYAESQSLFMRAGDIFPNARIQRGIGMTAFELRRYRESISALESALHSTVSPLDPVLRESTYALLQRARGFVGKIEIEVKPRNAEVTVDGVAPAEDQDGRLTLELGQHTFEIAAAGYRPQRHSLLIRGGEATRLAVELARGK